MDSSSRNEVHEAHAKVSYGLPRESERKNMSVLQLAELLATMKEKSPGYLVIEHELNLKIAKTQAKATLNAGWLGASATLIASLATFALGIAIGTSQPKVSNQANCEKTSAAPATQPDSKPSDGVEKPNAILPAVPLGKKDAPKAAQKSYEIPKP